MNYTLDIRDLIGKSIERDKVMESEIKKGLEVATSRRTRYGLKYYVVETTDETLLVMQQNRYKSSKWAELARQGHDVWQVMRNIGGYVGVIIDKKYYRYIGT